MKLAVLGSTGFSGVLVVNQALELDHNVVALVRNPDKMTMKHRNLQVVKCDIYSADSLAESFKECDAVISCLGADTLSNVTIYSQSIPAIVGGMKKAGVKRLIAITSWGTTYDPNEPGPFFLEWILKPLVLKHVLADMAKMEQYLKDTAEGDIDFTCVRPPGLSKRAVTKKEIYVAEEKSHVPRVKSKIERADVARFIIGCLVSEQYRRKCVAIGVQ